MNYGIKKILKEKRFKNGRIIMAELLGLNLYSVMVFDENDKLVDSLCNCCFEKKYVKDILKLTRREYKKKMKEWFYEKSAESQSRS